LPPTITSRCAGRTELAGIRSATATIDSELRLPAAVRRVCREHGTLPSIGPVDALLDERGELTEADRAH
jgi:hypothetical protein